MMTQHVLLTGATGYIGRHVLARLLSEGFRVTLIIRRRKGLLQERLNPLFDAFPQLNSLDLKGQLHVLEGDVTRSHCGLKPEALVHLRNQVDAFIHCAGLTCFDKDRESDLRLQNATGVRHAFELCRTLGITQFHYVSTAFVAGNTPVRFSSQSLDLGQTFKNPYEKTKFEAEVYLHRRLHDPHVVTSIYRPSIVVGGRVMGETRNSTTLYTFLRCLHFIRECCRNGFEKEMTFARRYNVRLRDCGYHIPLRFAAQPDTPLHLVSVFRLVDEICENLVDKPSGSKVIPVLNSEARTIREVRDVFCRVLGLEGVELISADAWIKTKRTPLEERLFRATRAYEPYLYSSPVLDLDERRRGCDEKISLDSIAREFIDELENTPDRRMFPGLNTLALNCIGAEEPEEYLEHFSGNDFGGSFMKRIPFVKARGLFRVIGDLPVEKWIEFDYGIIRRNSARNLLEPDFGYEMDEATFQRIVHGVLDPRTAFFQGKLKLLGDPAMSLKLGFVFREYFHNINDRLMEELVEV